MSLNHLLLWLSAKGEGSWTQFRAAVEVLHVDAEDESLEDNDEGTRQAVVTSDLPIYQRVRFALQRLGHVEFFASEADQGWRIVPPAIALRPGCESEGVLCGARTPNLLQALSSTQSIDVLVDTGPGIPDRILVRSDSVHAMVSAVGQLGLLVQPDAPAVILSALPSVRDRTSWFPVSIPDTPGWRVHRFSPSRLGWRETVGTEAMAASRGLFRFLMKHQRFYYLRWRGRTYRVPVQVGKYAVMRRQHRVLAYDAETQCVSIPAACRPPLLIERALVLCSGFLPRFDPSSGRLAYAAVPPDIARLAAQLLHQEMR
jgi:hypothetical protein